MNLVNLMEPQDAEAGNQIEIDGDVYQLLVAKAAWAGRNISAQLEYELKLNRGLVEPDPGDTEGRERADVFRLVLHGSPYRRVSPLMG